MQMADKVEAISHLERVIEQCFANSGTGGGGGSTGGGTSATPLVYRVEEITYNIDYANANYPQWVAGGTRTVSGTSYKVYSYDLGGKLVKDVQLFNYNFKMAMMIFTYADGSETVFAKGAVNASKVNFTNTNISKVEILINSASGAPTGTLILGIEE